MPIISKYSVLGYSKNGEIIIDSDEECLCPKCKKGILKQRRRDRRHIKKEETGEKVWYLIPVGKCNDSSCGRQARLLTDFMVPYKHYEEQAISDVLDEVITEDSPVCCPSIFTMRRWLVWFTANLTRMENVLRSVGYRELGFSEELLFLKDSLVDQLRQRSGDWLRIAIRFIYNSGHHLKAL